MNVEKNIIDGALYENVYTQITPWVQSIGICPYQMRYRESVTLTSIAESYFLNSMYSRGKVEDIYSMSSYLADAGVMMTSLNEKRDNSNAKIVKLPKSTPLNLKVDEAITQRRSIRTFTGKSMPYSYLASILRSAVGISAVGKANLTNGDDIPYSFRNHPSAGGLL